MIYTKKTYKNRLINNWENICFPVLNYDIMPVRCYKKIRDYILKNRKRVILLILLCIISFFIKLNDFNMLNQHYKLFGYWISIWDFVNTFTFFAFILGYNPYAARDRKIIIKEVDKNNRKTSKKMEEDKMLESRASF